MFQGIFLFFLECSEPAGHVGGIILASNESEDVCSKIFLPYGCDTALDEIYLLDGIAYGVKEGQIVEDVCPCTCAGKRSQAIINFS